VSTSSVKGIVTCRRHSRHSPIQSSRGDRRSHVQYARVRVVSPVHLPF
jgi:hypothetical protein